MKEISYPQFRRLCAALGAGLLALAGLLLMLGLHPRPALADPGDLFVELGGSGDCSQATPCSLQTALGSATGGDTIYIAQGTYTGSGGAVVTVTQSIALYGGWDGSPTGPVVRDPEAYPTTLDGEGQRRVIYIPGAYLSPITPTLEGLRITNGSADRGGGAYARYAHLTIRTCQVFSNTASDRGGGAYLDDSNNTTLTGNRIYSNTATDSGGGVYLNSSDHVTMMDNQVRGNTADVNGGGVCLSASDNATLAGNEVYGNRALRGGGICLAASDDATLTRNLVYSNTADVNGGGMYFSGADSATLTANQIYSNTADTNGGGGHLINNDNTTLTANQIYSNTASTNGGGMYFSGADSATLTANQVYSNTAGYSGGGLYFNTSEDATLVNNMILENRITGGGNGPGVYVRSSNTHLLHTTIARNHGGEGSGVYVSHSGSDYSIAALTNTILVSQTTGIFVTASNTATLEATLWGSGAWANGDDWGGSGYIVTGTINLWDDPGFADPDSGDYHITFGSAARNAGVDAGVTADVDGDSRLFDAQPDIGADEYFCHVSLNGTLYPTVQAAVDAANEGDIVQVAGACQGVQTRSSNQQVAYITKTLTIRGGYDADFSTWDPQAYPTTLDAQGQGRVIYITGDITPTIEGLRLTNGSASIGGGGIYALNSHPVISGCQLCGNTAGNSGGGAYLFNSHNARLTGNAIFSNTALFGGGINLRDSPNVNLTGNEIYDNAATYGGGISLRDSDATLTNNIIADNHANSWASGLYVWGASPRLLHNTIAHNTGGDGSGIYVTDRNGIPRTVFLTNTILVSHTVGITVTGINTVTLEATLWGSEAWANGEDWGGGGAILTGTVNVRGEPAFVDPDDSDYHIGPGSAAIDAGVDAGVTSDIDGDPRPWPTGGDYDIGADESILRRVYLPLVMKDHP